MVCTSGTQCAARSSSVHPCPFCYSRAHWSHSCTIDTQGISGGAAIRVPNHDGPRQQLCGRQGAGGQTQGRQAEASALLAVVDAIRLWGHNTVQCSAEQGAALECRHSSKHLMVGNRCGQSLGDEGLKACHA
jgi:hypothetical protein